MNSTMTEMDCGRVIEQLDLYLDRELSTADREAIERHLQECESCTGVITSRTAMRVRFQSAVRGTDVPAGLGDRILKEVRHTPAVRPRSAWQRWSVGIAAAAMIVGGLGAAYELGHLRYTAESQERYIAWISGRVVYAMRAGLGDHVHCAFFRKYPRQAPPPETIAADMGPQFLPLVQIVRDHIPSDQRVVMAHRCSYHKRKFVHLTMVDGRHLSSLVIAERQPGESFQDSGLTPAMSDIGLPIYRSGVQRFHIDGFQTGGHLVYLISDLSSDANGQMMAKLATPVHQFLKKLEL